MEESLFNEVNLERWENGKPEVIKEKLINDIFLEVRINGNFIENVLCVNDKLRELAVGNFYQCTDIDVKYIAGNTLLHGNTADINISENLSSKCLYRRNCGCMVNEGEILHGLPSVKSALNYNIINPIFNNFQKLSELFRNTAGVHGAGLYDHEGNNLFFALDIARHNCITKAAGYIIENSLYGEDTASPIIMLSSRVNAELVKMCYKAGIKSILSRGAPSFGAYKEAERLSITLISFVREGRFTVVS